MPEEQIGAVYGSGDGSLTPMSYAKETQRPSQPERPSSSVFITRNGVVFAANQAAHVLTVVNRHRRILSA